MPKLFDRVGWLVPGQMLLVNGQVLPLQDCQIVLSRRVSSRQHTKLERDDDVPVVEFWFTRPIQGAAAYALAIRAGRVVLTQVTEQIQDWKDVQWLVIVSGDAAGSLQILQGSYLGGICTKAK